jgi:choice-of-anchor A domain-containing protein
VVVNVSGADIDKSGSNVVLTGIDERKVLLNFYEATSWKSMYIDVKGSVLAPFAQTATISGGAITGTSIIAGDVTKTGSAEFHNSLFTGDLSVVPEPGNAGLLGLLAAAGLSLRSRCRLAGGAA